MIKKFLYRIITFGIIIIIVNQFLGFVMKSFERDLIENKIFFPAQRWDDYYSNKKQIDLLFIGSSHVYRTIIPHVFDDGLTINSFNMGSSGQSPITGYYITEEILNKHQPKVVVMDVYFNALGSNNPQLENGRVNLDYMNFSKSKFNFFLKGFSFSEKMKLLFFPAFAHRHRLPLLLRKAIGLPYLPTNRGKYTNKGYVQNKDTILREIFLKEDQFSNFQFDKNKVNTSSIEHLIKATKLCKSKGIKVIWVTIPIPKLSYAKILNTDEIHSYITKLSKQVDVEYFDYNEKRVDEIIDYDHYFDNNHLNEAGAKIFSNYFMLELKIFSFFDKRKISIP